MLNVKTWVTIVGITAPMKFARKFTVVPGRQPRKRVPPEMPVQRPAGKLTAVIDETKLRSSKPTVAGLSRATAVRSSRRYCDRFCTASTTAEPRPEPSSLMS